MCETSPNQPLEHVQALLRERLRGRVWDLHVVLREDGVVLQGQAVSYHAKQLGQHIAITELRLTVVANEIEVCRVWPPQEPQSGDTD
jgi:hypothetical protein